MGEFPNKIHTTKDASHSASGHSPRVSGCGADGRLSERAVRGYEATGLRVDACGRRSSASGVDELEQVHDPTVPAMPAMSCAFPFCVRSATPFGAENYKQACGAFPHQVCKSSFESWPHQWQCVIIV